MPFEDEFFDLVVSHGLIKCIPDKVKAFKEVCRVLKTGGFAFLIDVRKEALRELEKIASRISLEEYTKRKRAMEKGLTSDEVEELFLKSNLKKRANLEKKAFKFQIVIHK
ncbi:MAG: methyltransferase domain-containing protein [Candidatus Subteraquimicrobiales bacterium]|nr:methyltransferase domain-containing protein [Candidatus Subteraquimicrobiales bacterium]